MGAALGEADTRPTIDTGHTLPASPLQHGSSVAAPPAGPGSTVGLCWPTAVRISRVSSRMDEWGSSLHTTQICFPSLPLPPYSVCRKPQQQQIRHPGRDSRRPFLRSPSRVPFEPPYAFLPALAATSDPRTSCMTVSVLLAHNFLFIFATIELLSCVSLVSRG